MKRSGRQDVRNGGAPSGRRPVGNVPGALRGDRLPVRGPTQPSSQGPGYWLSGRQAVLAALQRGRVGRLLVAEGAHGLDVLLAAAEAAGLAVERMQRDALDRLAATDAQGCAAWVAPIVPVALETVLADLGNVPRALLVACDRIQDPHNLGAIARTAEAVAAAGLILPEHRAAGLSPGAERAAAGALQSLRCAVVHNLTWGLDRCRAAGFWTYGAAPDGDVDYTRADFAAKAVLVVGAEGRGLSPLVRRHCDRILRLPMWGSVQSLNAAVAAGILMYEWARGAVLEGHAH